MKKLLTPILTAAAIVVLSTSIFAAQDSASLQQTSSGRTQPNQVVAGQKAKRAEFKAQIAPLKEEVKTNRDANQDLREQNKSLIQQIQDKLTTIKSSESKLSPEQKSTLKTLKSEIKTLRNEIFTTKGEIKEILTGNKENVKSMNLEAVQAAFDKVYEIQNFRHEKLVQINTKLADMVSELN